MHAWESPLFKTVFMRHIAALRIILEQLIEEETLPPQAGSSQKTIALKKAQAPKQLIHHLSLHMLANAYQQDVGRIHPNIWLISQTFEKVIGLKDVCDQRAIAKGRQT